MEASTSIFTTFTYLYYIGWVIINVFAAIWIYNDAKNLSSLFINSKPIWWAFSALILGGIWVSLVYWVIHHSTISNRANNNET